MSEKQGIATLSDADRAKVESLQSNIKQLEQQLASTIGTYVGLADARVAAWETGKHGDARLAVRVVGDATPSATNRGPFCVIYMDPPGICYPC